MDEESVRTVLAKNIKKLRRAAKLTQDKFAKKLGVSKASISKYEKGLNFFPIDKLPLVIKTLGCSIQELFYPLFEELPIDIELKDLFDRIKAIYRLPKAQRDLYSYLELIERAYDIRIPTIEEPIAADIFIPEKKQKKPPKKRADGRANRTGSK